MTRFLRARASRRLAVSALPLLVASVATAEVAPSLQSPAPVAAGRVLEGHVLRLDPRLVVDRAVVEVAVRLGDDDVVLELTPHSIRSDVFQVIVQREGGVLEAVPAPPVRTVRGVVKGRAGSAVAGSFLDGRLTATVVLDPDQPSWNIEPLDRHVDGVDPLDHLSYSISEVAPHGRQCACAVHELPRAGDSFAVVPDRRDISPPAAGRMLFHRENGRPAVESEPEAMALGGLLEIAEVAVDADVQYFIKNGASVANTVADIEGVLNASAFVYERDVDLTYEITTIVVRSDFTSNPYSTSDAELLLDQYRDEWSSPPLNSAPRDVNQLFTGRSLVGGTLGIAFLGTICNGGANYSLVESRFSGAIYDERISLTSHEFGHTWNAGHCNGSFPCHIMCATINFCNGTTGGNLKFGNASINSITAFASTRPCIDTVPPAPTVPFFEDWPTTSVNGSKWIYRTSTAAPTTVAENEPSAPNSLRLASLGDLPWRQGDIRSNFINLLGESGLVLDFWVQQGTVEAGEFFFVDILNSAGTWSNVFILEGDGVAQTDFTRYTLPLPASAYHDQFRVRFRSEGQDSNDFWFVDDIYIGEPIVADPCPADLDGNNDVGFSDLLELLAAWGPCSECSADLDGSGDVGFSDLLVLLAAWGPCP